MVLVAPGERHDYHQAPMRLNVTGNAGAGKTSLSKRLGAALGLPVISLDSIVWQPNWFKTPAGARARAEGELTEQSNWVIDGVSSQVRAKADLVVFLDVPRHVCAARCLVRALRYFKRTRPEMPPGCPEIDIVPRLLRLVYRFPSTAGAQIRVEAQLEPTRFRVVSYPFDAEVLAQELARQCGEVAAANRCSLTSEIEGAE